MKRVLVPIVTSFLLAGCATHTTQKEIWPHVWWVCDGSKDSDACGPNPEKGLNLTCFSKHEKIREYSRIAGGALIVRCE
jgi:hypothetical protein